MAEEDITTLFRRSWSLYDFITERNYMFHRELYQEIGRLLSRRAAMGAYRLLDLGCGNARFLAPCLKAAPPSAYTGVDLSEAALAEAASWLADLPNIKLVQTDLLAALEAPGESHELIFTGFALHHLLPESKQRFFRAAANRLPPGGWLLILDIAREPGQSRETYLRSYIRFMTESWLELPRDQFAEAQAHIEAFDHPETAEDLTAMAINAGFASTTPIASHGHHHLTLFVMPF